VTKVLVEGDKLLAFNKLKEVLTTAPTLALPDFTKPFKVITDASDFAMGAILLQEGRPLAFESQKLTPAEQNYHTTDKELLAVKKALELWRCYLEGSEFVVVTDHNPLVHLQTQPHLSRRQARWLEFFQSFNFTWEYKPGVGNPADPLSRLADPGDESPAVIGHRGITDDPWLALPGNREGFSVHENLGLKAGNVGGSTEALECERVVLKSVELTEPPSRQQRDPAVGPVCLKGYANDPWFTFPGNREGLHKQGGLYFKADMLVVPVGELRERLVKFAHDDCMMGHGGVAKTLHQLRKEFWWPKMKKDVVRVVQACQYCQRNKARKQKAQGKLLPLPIPPSRWYTVTMDFVTDLPLTSKGHDAILVYTDKLTKMVHFVPTTKTCDAVKTVELFRDNIVRLHGLPKELLSDRGGQFTSHYNLQCEKIWGIKHLLSSSHHPQTDGQTERVNAVMEDYLRHYVGANQTDWEDHLAMAEFAYNNSFHTAIQTTPFLLNYGFEPLTPLAFLSEEATKRRGKLIKEWEDMGVQDKCPAAMAFTELMNESLIRAKACIEAANQRTKRYADEHREHATYQLGEQVLLATKNMRIVAGGTRKFSPRYVGPFKIIQIINPVAYRLELPKSMSRLHDVFHVSLLKKYVPERGSKAPPLPIIFQGEALWLVDHIVDSRVRGGKREYLVRWDGYSAENDTWEPEKNLVLGCEDLLTEYKKRIQQKGALELDRQADLQPTASGEKGTAAPPITKPPTRENQVKQTRKRVRKDAPDEASALDERNPDGAPLGIAEKPPRKKRKIAVSSSAKRKATRT
jgi:hypothetical protein